MPNNLQIPNPCNEKWNAMTPAGFDCRFCAACQKNIVDFTQKTDAEILAHLRKNDGRICGRFHPKQLNRPLVAARVPRRGGLAAVAISFAATLAAQQPTQAQQPQEKEGIYVPLAGAYKAIAQLFKDGPQDSLRTISGKVVDAETSEPLIGCAISIENTNYGVISNIEGEFSIQIPLSQLSNNKPTLLIRYTGFEEKRIPLPIEVQKENWPLPNIELVFALESSVLGEIAYKKPTFKQRLLHFFQRN